MPPGFRRDAYREGSGLDFFLRRNVSFNVPPNVFRGLDGDALFANWNGSGLEDCQLSNR